MISKVLCSDRHTRNVDMLHIAWGDRSRCSNPSEVTIFFIGKEPFIEDGTMSEEGGFRRSKTWTSSVKHFVDLLQTHPCTCHVFCIFQMPLTCSGPQPLTFFLFFTPSKGPISFNFNYSSGDICDFVITNLVRRRSCPLHIHIFTSNIIVFGDGPFSNRS